jgi:hypothetical protein
MKKQNWLTNLGLVALLWFSLAFACKNGGSRSQTPNQDNETPTISSSQNTGGELTEQIVREYFTKFHTERCESAVLDCKVVFETPIQIGAATRRSIEGGLPPPEGGLALAYPVRVDYSVYKANKGTNPDGLWSRYRGGVHYFYRDVNLVWNDAPSGVNLTWDK